MSIRTARFQLRLEAEDRALIQQLAHQAQRTESEFVRLLVRSVDPAMVSNGIPAATQHAGGSRTEMEVSREREPSAA